MRLEEIRQSARIIEQALERMADEGPINVDDPRVILPPKEDVYTTIEGTIQHFKIVMEGVKVPAGEATRTPKAATASSASTSSPTAAARRTACASARRASRSRSGLEQLITGA